VVESDNGAKRGVSVTMTKAKDTNAVKGLSLKLSELSELGKGDYTVVVEDTGFDAYAIEVDDESRTVRMVGYYTNYN